MLWPKDAEVAVIECRDSVDVEALGGRHDTAVDDVEFGVGVGVGDFEHSWQVCTNDRFVYCINDLKVAQKYLYTSVPKISPEEIADFGQYHVWNDKYFVIGGGEVRSGIVLGFVLVEERIDETAIRNNGHEVRRRLR